MLTMQTAQLLAGSLDAARRGRAYDRRAAVVGSNQVAGAAQ